jgi:hypothetical protein
MSRCARWRLGMGTEAASLRMIAEHVGKVMASS